MVTNFIEEYSVCASIETVSFIPMVVWFLRYVPGTVLWSRERTQIIALTLVSSIIHSIQFTYCHRSLNTAKSAKSAHLNSEKKLNGQ